VKDVKITKVNVNSEKILAFSFKSRGEKLFSSAGHNAAFYVPCRRDFNNKGLFEAKKMWSAGRRLPFESHLFTIFGVVHN
jgi:hypothetical protein